MMVLTLSQPDSRQRQAGEYQADKSQFVQVANILLSQQAK